MSYTFGATVEGSMKDVEEKVAAALSDEGFGILTRIDVQATLKAKIDVDRDPYVILGACNPTLAHQAISADEDLGALLPCNVVLRAVDSSVAVRVMDPEAVLSIVGNPVVDEAGATARAKLEKVVASLK
jgi:uncharacterized protein (DUF302 family)